MEKIQPTREQIIEDVRLWSKHFLEVPNLHLGGVPACPFAKKAWMEKEILIFCDPYYSYSPDELHMATEDFNEWYNRKDFYFMSFHPSNPATEKEQEFLVYPQGKSPEVESNLKYSMMLVQKFSQLQQASDKLKKQGYYSQWPKGYYRDVVVSREDKYKKINGGLS